MASLQHLAAVMLTLGLLAGCGGDRSRTGAGADTTGAAVVKPDSAAMPVTDTTVPARDPTQSAAPSTSTDTGAAAAAPATKAPSTKPAAKAPAAPSSAAEKQMAAAGARTAHDTAAASSGQAQQDTSRVQKAESTNRAAAPAPAPAPQQQDTSKATAGAAEQPLRDAYHQAPRDTVSQAVYDGWKQFNLNCARCHGEDVLGTTIAPHLIVSLKPDGPINSKELFVQTVCAGRPEKGMPSWCALGLDMNKINDIYEYVKGRSDAKIGPGRPAVKQQG
jgi:hypothetical protein